MHCPSYLHSTVLNYSLGKCYFLLYHSHKYTQTANCMFWVLKCTLGTQRHSLTYTVVMFWKVRHHVIFCASQNWVWVWSKMCVCVCVCVYGSPSEIQTATRGNLIDRSMTTPPPVLSHSSILPPPLFHCTFITAKEIWCGFLKMLFLLSKIVWLEVVWVRDCLYTNHGTVRG